MSTAHTGELLRPPRKDISLMMQVQKIENLTFIVNKKLTFTQKLFMTFIEKSHSKDINNLLKAENNLVGSFYGDSKEGYSNLGGLSVYVPPSLVPEPPTGPVKEDPTFKERQSKYSLASWNDLLQELGK